MSLAAKHWRDANLLGQSFLNEVEMSRRLSSKSKHIAHIYDFDFHRNDGWSYFVMDLAQHDLEKALRSRSLLSSTERKYIWRQLVNIAVTLHNHKIVSVIFFLLLRLYLIQFFLIIQIHLDIKPENLLVYPGNMIKLGDLGIAQNAHQGR